jgi:hypothetical protein
MNKFYAAAVVSAVVWVYLAFIAAIPSGWVHVPLVAAVLLITWGIVEGKGN